MGGGGGGGGPGGDISACTYAVRSNYSPLRQLFGVFGQGVQTLMVEIKITESKNNHYDIVNPHNLFLHLKFVLGSIF